MTASMPPRSRFKVQQLLQELRLDLLVFGLCAVPMAILCSPKQKPPTQQREIVPKTQPATDSISQHTCPIGSKSMASRGFVDRPR